MIIFVTLGLVLFNILAAVFVIAVAVPFIRDLKKSTTPDKKIVEKSSRKILND
jgi:hypothetical protein